MTGSAVERADNLRQAVNSSAPLVRNVFLTFLLFGTYIAVTVGSTTDEQLLRVSPVTLPILGVNLPIVAFYAVVPWLLVLFHFNLLLQIYLLSRQLHRFNAAVDSIEDARDRAEQRVRLFPFPIVQLLSGREKGVAPVLFGLIVWVTVICMPLVLIVAMQVRFLPYHSPAVVTWDRLAVAADVAFLWVFWPPTVSPAKRPAATWWRYVSNAPRRLIRGKDSDSAPERPARGFSGLLALSVLAVGFSSLVAAIPGEPFERVLGVVFPAPGSEDEPFERPGNGLTHWVFDREGAPLRRSLELAELVLLADGSNPDVRELRIEKDRNTTLYTVSGIDLSGRDLRYANLRNTVLAGVDLRGANLDGADLRGADLGAADFRPLEVGVSGSCIDDAQYVELDLGDRANRESGEYGSATPRVCVGSMRLGARLTDARLDYARMHLALLSDADFRNANMPNSLMNGADLTGARFGGTRTNLEYATLDYADLTGADFASARLVSAKMQRVNLTRAVLDHTELRSASIVATASEGMTVNEPDLTHARFSGSTDVDLSSAVIRQGEFASFHRVDLSGADLSRSNFRGARFAADLRGANLAGADLRGADFEGSDLSDARLGGARLDLAQLLRASACRADFSDASMRGVHIYNARLQGASLNDADLSFAILNNVRLEAVDLRGARVDAVDGYRLRLDYGDLRALASAGSGQAPEFQGLKPLISELRQGGRNLSDRQQRMVASIEGGEVQRETADTFVREPMLCDASTAAFIGDHARCTDESELDQYVSAVTEAACDDPNVLAGLMHRLAPPPPPLVGRAGNVISTPPVDDYTRVLATALAAQNCPALGSLGVAHKALLREILERSEVAIPGNLEAAAVVASPPACEADEG